MLQRLENKHRGSGLTTAIAAGAALFLADSDKRQMLAGLARYAGQLTGLGPRLEALIGSLGLETRTEHVRDAVSTQAGRALEVGTEKVVAGAALAGRKLTAAQYGNAIGAIQTNAGSALKLLERGDASGAKRSLDRLAKNVTEIGTLDEAQQAGFERFIAGAKAAIDEDPKNAATLLKEGPGARLFTGPRQTGPDLITLLGSIGKETS